MAFTASSDRLRGWSRGTSAAVLPAMPTAAAALDPPASRAASPCRVFLIEPREGEILCGMVDLSAEADCPEGTSADHVQFLADGGIVAETTGAPFRSVREGSGTLPRPTGGLIRGNLAPDPAPGGGIRRPGFAGTAGKRE